MAAKTLRNLIDQAARHLSLDPADITVDPEQLQIFTGYCNDALRELEKFGDWPFLYAEGTAAATAGSDTAPLPTDFAKFRMDSTPYYVGTVGRLEFAPLREIQEKRSTDIATTGQPQIYNAVWLEDADRYGLTLYPRPDLHYTIRVPYQRAIPEMSDLDDRPRIPEPLHSTLALGCCAVAQELQEKVGQSAQRPKWMAELQQAWARFGSVVTDQGLLRLKPRSAPRAPDYRVVRIDAPGG